jgi:hypothetical protein
VGGVVDGGGLRQLLAGLGLDVVLGGRGHVTSP